MFCINRYKSESTLMLQYNKTSIQWYLMPSLCIFNRYHVSVYKKIVCIQFIVHDYLNRTM